MPTKEEIRMNVWKYMESNEIALPPRPCYYKVPNFIGSRYAAARLSRSSYFRNAEVIYVAQDPPLIHVREEVLRSGKLLITSSYRLRKGFFLLDPGKIHPKAIRAAVSLRGVSRYGEAVSMSTNHKVDLYVIGSVAVTLNGARLGRGGGFSDLEYGILREMKIVRKDTPIATIVHECQIVEDIPMEIHDVPVDIIATPSRLIETKNTFKKPPGIIWDLVTIDIINEFPILKQLSGF